SLPLRGRPGGGAGGRGTAPPRIDRQLATVGEARRRMLGPELGHFPHLDSPLPGSAPAAPEAPDRAGGRNQEAAVFPLLRPAGAARLPSHLHPRSERSALRLYRLVLRRRKGRRAPAFSEAGDSVSRRGPPLLLADLAERCPVDRRQLERLH